MSGVEAPGGRPCREAELLLLCARTAMEAERAERARALLTEAIDWEKLLRMASAHGMTPLLCRNLARQASTLVPPDVMGRLRAEADERGRGNLRRFHAMARLVEALAERGVDAIPYKGPVLAVSVYGDLALRQFDDLDILVRPEDVLKAREVLLAAGYRAVDRWLDDGLERALQQKHHCAFDSADGQLNVELHWAIVPPYFAFPLDIRLLWERAARISLGGTTLLNLAAEDLLLVLCVHGAKHAWRRLCWICDLAEVLRASPAIDWERLLGQARSLRSERVLRLGLFLATDLLGATLPDEVARGIARDRAVRSLGARVRAFLFHGHETDDPSRFFVHLVPLGALSRARDQVRYGFSEVRYLLSAVREGRALLPLPPSLAALNLLYRPLRAAGKCGRSLFGRSQKGSRFQVPGSKLGTGQLDGNLEP